MDKSYSDGWVKYIREKSDRTKSGKKIRKNKIGKKSERTKSGEKICIKNSGKTKFREKNQIDPSRFRLM